MLRGFLQNSKSLLLVAVLILSTVLGAEAKKVKVQGTVRDQSGKPIRMLSITQDYDLNDPTMGQYEITRTNNSGEFIGTFEVSNPVHFIGGDGYEATRTMTESRNQDIILTEDDIMSNIIEDVQIVTPGVTLPKKTKIKIVGDHMVIPMGVIIEHAWFAKGRRLMLVPLIKDLLAEGDNDSIFYLEPRVLDGAEYHMIDDRKYNYDSLTNPLLQYTEVLAHSDSTFKQIAHAKANTPEAIAARKAQEAADKIKRDSLAKIKKDSIAFVNNLKDSLNKMSRDSARYAIMVRDSLVKYRRDSALQVKNNIASLAKEQEQQRQMAMMAERSYADSLVKISDDKIVAAKESERLGYEKLRIAQLSYKSVVKDGAKANAVAEREAQAQAAAEAAMAARQERDAKLAESKQAKAEARAAAAAAKAEAKAKAKAEAEAEAGDETETVDSENEEIAEEVTVEEVAEEVTVEEVAEEVAVEEVAEEVVVEEIVEEVAVEEVAEVVTEEPTTDEATEESTDESTDETTDVAEAEVDPVAAAEAEIAEAEAQIAAAKEAIAEAEAEKAATLAQLAEEQAAKQAQLQEESEIKMAEIATPKEPYIMEAATEEALAKETDFEKELKQHYVLKEKVLAAGYSDFTAENLKAVEKKENEAEQVAIKAEELALKQEQDSISNAKKAESDKRLAAVKAKEQSDKDKRRELIKAGKRVDVANSFVYDWTDSIKFNNNHGNFIAQIRIAIEDYNRVVFIDTVEIAKGTSDPLRFFSYEIEGLQLRDSDYIPAPMTVPLNDAASVSINFQVNSTAIDSNDAASQAELDKIITRMKTLLNNPDAEVKSVKINGVASPDGPYDKNSVLANKRSAFILNQVKSSVSQDDIKGVKMEYTSEVESWLTVADRIEKLDSLGRIEAEQIRDIVAKYPRSFDNQWSHIRLMKRYKEIISPYILPKLRRVEYSIEYVITRVRTSEEVAEIFAENSLDELKKLYNEDKTLYQIDLYNLLIGSEGKDNYRETVEKIVAIDPFFTIAVNDLAVLNIRDGIFDTALLSPFIERVTPRPIRYNQSIMMLRTNQIDSAYELIYRLPDTPEFFYIRMLVDAKFGDYRKGITYYSERGGINEVILLLATDKNKEAYMKVKMLADEPDNSKLYYVKAVCAFRMSEDLSTDALDAMAMQDEAITWAMKAVELEPKMGEIMKVDSDITGLLPHIEKRKQDIEKQKEAELTNSNLE